MYPCIKYTMVSDRATELLCWRKYSSSMHLDAVHGGECMFEKTKRTMPPPLQHFKLFKLFKLFNQRMSILYPYLSAIEAEQQSRWVWKVVPRRSPLHIMRPCRNLESWNPRALFGKDFTKVVLTLSTSSVRCPNNTQKQPTEAKTHNIIEIAKIIFPVSKTNDLSFQ
jgi:hypothetical protein